MQNQNIGTSLYTVMWTSHDWNFLSITTLENNEYHMQSEESHNPSAERMHCDPPRVGYPESHDRSEVPTISVCHKPARKEGLNGMCFSRGCLGLGLSPPKAQLSPKLGAVYVTVPALACVCFSQYRRLYK